MFQPLEACSLTRTMAWFQRLAPLREAMLGIGSGMMDVPLPVLPTTRISRLEPKLQPFILAKMRPRSKAILVREAPIERVCSTEHRPVIDDHGLLDHYSHVYHFDHIKHVNQITHNYGFNVTTMLATPCLSG